MSHNRPISNANALNAYLFYFYFSGYHYPQLDRTGEKFMCKNFPLKDLMNTRQQMFNHYINISINVV